MSNRIIVLRESSLFKYRKISDYVIESIKDNYLYFNHPNEFNDPFDCVIKSKYYGTNLEFEAYIKNTFGINYISSTKKKELIRGIRSASFSSIEMRNDLTANIRLCCLTNCKNDILMWSHYGDSHKGICIEYDFDLKVECGSEYYSINTNKQQVKINGNWIDKLIAKNVDYVPSLPKAFNPLRDDRNDIIMFLYKKYLKWSYENEKRIVMSNSHLADDKIILKENAIKSIYFGLKTEKNDEDKIKEMLLERKSWMPKLYKAKKSISNDFALEFQEIKMA